MSFDPSQWKRCEFENVPIYVRGDQPCWFVPNRAGDELLQRWQRGEAPSSSQEAERFRQRLPDLQGAGYGGRDAILKTEHLRELWFHLTNRCNLTCRHCLFTSGPAAADELSLEDVGRLAAEAVDLGCRVFALTGGEPFVHPQFAAIVRDLLAYRDTQVVVLTNGLQLSRHLETADWDLSRFHLQVSVDGLEERHDRIRGKGTFAALGAELAWLKARELPFTLSMCVEQDNVADMPALIDYAADVGATTVHFLWYFVRGRAAAEGFVSPDELFHQLRRAAARGKARGIRIDNLEALRTQAFAPVGTVQDGSNSGWESVAVGPDRRLYPSAATVGMEELASDLSQGLAAAWRHGESLQRLREATAASLSSPWRFFTGGGDADHSFFHGGRFVGDDPYVPLYEKVLLWLIAAEAGASLDDDRPHLRLKMGDVLENCGAHGAVALTHANCLLSLANHDSRRIVKDFYAAAVGDSKEEILNPVCYDSDLIAHIPAEFRFRGYGCGSPVLDAGLQPGETVVDLGCGGGVECFIAARLVGAEGRSIGVDMLDPMLGLARRGAQGVRANLGYDNLTFEKGYLEELPLAEKCADVILSNCVLNLSSHKRRTFAGIFRALKPGGRLVVADVVCDSEPGGAIRNDTTLHGECIGGALTQQDLVGLLEEAGFANIRLLKRFPYRTVQNHPFYSLTFVARKPEAADRVRVMYRGPFASVTTSSGQTLALGREVEISASEASQLGEQIFVFDAGGAVSNLDLGAGCGCALSPEARTDQAAVQPSAPSTMKYGSGCMVCGAPLDYFPQERPATCTYCGQNFAANASCMHGHFVCDGCHSQDALQVIEQICLESRETDLLALFDRIRRHPAIPTHGPEHHALVPAVILTTFGNLGGPISPDQIRAGIQRGSKVIGGSCAFLGACGAATGVGVAFSLLLEANPLKGVQRQQVQQLTQEVLSRIASLNAPRCCRRDGWVALKAAAELSGPLLSIPLRAEAVIGCHQQADNRECIGTSCPLHQNLLEVPLQAHPG
ncbi:DUF5714 domain-containing protein [Desulfuromonas sp. AOP6]|uniref:DUF5714 domain-containing protein n=1 Tax=Desulfuromonas sp. AOP6 TaxID=1566351 RepID=UPI001270238B|nr:DUF5714 domain-containing protein [Desulfuromonas sp. AOP6]BCA80818.1 hypothetical protein AOP6_2605 [Desulfuromonas sp. AOP6]